MTKHIENDQNNLAVPKAKQVFPEDLRPLPTAAEKKWDSAVVFYRCTAATSESTRGGNLKSEPYFTTGPRDAVQGVNFERMHRALTLAEKFLPLELRAY